MHLPKLAYFAALSTAAAASAIIRDVSRGAQGGWTRLGFRFNARDTDPSFPTTATTETVNTQTLTTLKVRKLSLPNLPDNWTSKGCVWDDAKLPPLVSIFSYELEADDMSATACVEACNTRGATVAAVQNGNECWCGTDPGTTLQVIDETICNVPCAGDRTKICGGTESLNMFVKASLNLQHT